MAPAAAATHTIAMDILAVDDDEQDVELLRLAARGTGIALETVCDGEQGLAYLRGEGAYKGRPSPALVLLDLNMPRKDGRAFLAERRADPRLRVVPVVVLTTSVSPRDVRDCYALGANAFVTKPCGFNAYCAALRAIAHYWSAVARVPAPLGAAGPRS